MKFNKRIKRAIEVQKYLKKIQTCQNNFNKGEKQVNRVLKRLKKTERSKEQVKVKWRKKKNIEYRN